MALKRLCYQLFLTSTIAPKPRVEGSSQLTSHKEYITYFFTEQVDFAICSVFSVSLQVVGSHQNFPICVRNISISYFAPGLSLSFSCMVILLMKVLSISGVSSSM